MSCVGADVTKNLKCSSPGFFRLDSTAFLKPVATLLLAESFTIAVLNLQFLQFCHSTIQQHFDPILYHSDTIQLGNQQINREKNQGLNFLSFSNFSNFVIQRFNSILSTSYIIQILSNWKSSIQQGKKIQICLFFFKVVCQHS